MPSRAAARTEGCMGSAGRVKHASMAEGDPVVWISHSDVERCAKCSSELLQGSLILINPSEGIRCLKCEGLDGLVFLPSGDAALSRRAMAHSTRRAIVVQFSRARKRSERQGALVEEAALAQAQMECVQDAAEREKKAVKRRKRAEIVDQEYLAEFGMKILEQFPSCPREEAQAIAQHACRKYSGRVGRSAAAKDFEPKAIELAVRAHVRHVHTKYDELMDQDHDRRDARSEVRGQIELVLGLWRQVGMEERPAKPQP